MSKLGFLRYITTDIKKYIFEDIYPIYAVQKRFPSVRIERGVQIKSPDRLFLGENVIIQKGAILHCGGMEWCNNAGGINIGDNVYIGPYCVLFGAGGIRIGNDVLLAPNVVLASHQHTFTNIDKLIREQPTEFREVIIEDNVWIGSSVVILPGVTIGAGTIIGAGAVVTKSILSSSVAVGVPAQVIKRRN